MNKLRKKVSNVILSFNLLVEDMEKIRKEIQTLPVESRKAEYAKIDQKVDVELNIVFNSVIKALRDKKATINAKDTENLFLWCRENLIPFTIKDDAIIINMMDMFKYQTGAKAFHDVGVGGLYTHSLRLFKELYKQVFQIERYNCQELAKTVDVFDMAVIAIGHDLCKLHHYYMDEEEAWQYDNIAIKRHAILSYEVATQDLGLKLTKPVAASILMHMCGFYSKEDYTKCKELKLTSFINSEVGDRLIASVRLADNK